MRCLAVLSRNVLGAAVKVFHLEEPRAESTIAINECSTASAARNVNFREHEYRESNSKRVEVSTTPSDDAVS